MTPAESAEYTGYLERMRGRFGDEWEPFRLRVVSGDVIDGPEHASNGEATLCGIPRTDVVVMRHTFRASAEFACSGCAARG